MNRIFIVAGDTSGDIHAARLMSAIKLRIPDVEFIGIGGDSMEQQGLQSLVSLREISVVGFWEVAKKYRFFKRLLFQCEEILRTTSFDCFIPVDFPGFNMRLSSFAKTLSIPVFYYIAPQLWAWGASRAQKLAACVDKLLVVFPFEVEFFQKAGIVTEFVGHPLLDNQLFDQSVDSKEKRIAFLPGSRLQEVKKHIPVMLHAAEILHQLLPEYRFAIATSPSIDPLVYTKLIPKTWEMHTDSCSLMKNSTTGIVKTGTSTLEAALCEMPFVMMYKTSSISYIVSKNLIKLPYISLVNILVNKPVVQELIQHEATAENVAKALYDLCTNNTKRDEMRKEFSEIHTLLGSKGASLRAADCIVNSIRKS